MDQVTIVGTASKGLQRANIKTRLNRNPVIGDKFSSRHGQKGVLSVLWKDHDMPYCETTGMRYTSSSAPSLHALHALCCGFNDLHSWLIRRRPTSHLSTAPVLLLASDQCCSSTQLLSFVKSQRQPLHSRLEMQHACNSISRLHCQHACEDLRSCLAATAPASAAIFTSQAFSHAAPADCSKFTLWQAHTLQAFPTLKSVNLTTIYSTPSVSLT